MRGFSYALKEKFASKIDGLRSRVNVLKKDHGKVLVGTCNLGQIFGGMRGVPALMSQVSHLDPYEGISYRGFSLPEVRRRLHSTVREPSVEGLLWLLLTGEFPTEEEVEDLRQLMVKQALLPQETFAAVRSLPKSLDSNALLNIALLTLQRESAFQKAYSSGTLRKNQFWEPMLDDVVSITAKLPRLLGLVYSHKYRNREMPTVDPSKDLAGNLASYIGQNSVEFAEIIRLFYLLFADHDGGLVSSHTTHLVGSALSDSYISLSAGMSASGASLHAAAVVESLRWVLKCQEKLGERPTEKALEGYIRGTLAAKQVIPGYGHDVLMVTDPRFLELKVVAEQLLPNDPLCELVANLYRLVPHILMEQRARNPWPNVHAHSGALLYSLGLKQPEFLTALISVVRSAGELSSLVIARALMLPIERVDSLDLAAIEAIIQS